ncbi:MAG TPA: OsmC family protein [Verrucomicrobiae bacterium]|jgi:organic hydroperoxide reductase OsmC/OhrA|nr:OsmC family protein [Verrucomicrobiae bacterium]
MAEYKATISWTRKGSPEDFTKGKYSREHAWAFDGGVTVPGSSSPAVVPTPWSNPSAVDPEEALVAAISSCHMLTFVYLAQKAGFVVDAYEDAAVGTMTKGERGGTPWVSHVTLAPRIAWGGGKQPTEAEQAHLHHEAHEQCFIAQSVKTEITVARPS